MKRSYFLPRLQVLILSIVKCYVQITKIYMFDFMHDGAYARILFHIALSARSRTAFGSISRSNYALPTYIQLKIISISPKLACCRSNPAASCRCICPHRFPHGSSRRFERPGAKALVPDDRESAISALQPRKATER